MYGTHHNSPTIKIVFTWIIQVYGSAGKSLPYLGKNETFTVGTD